MNDHSLTRRNMLVSSMAGAGLLLSGCAQNAATRCGCKGTPAELPNNSDFYDSSGAFLPDKAKQAYIALMERFNYPIMDLHRSDDFAACDFLQRDFAKLGMGAVFWINQKGVYGQTGAKDYKGDFAGKNFGYLGLEIFLLPGQMLPEHNHIGGPDGFGPKMESWMVRRGSIELFGEYKGEEEVAIAAMPKSQRPWGCGESWFKCKYAARRDAKSGKLYHLNDPESFHFMRAGPQGAIVSEFATYHNHVAFSKPGLEFDNSKAT